MKHTCLFFLPVLLLVAIHRPLFCGAVTVDQGLDVIDIDPWTATIDDLPGPNGRISFSEAMIATNNTPGPDTVGFAMPRNEWLLQFLYPGCAVVQSTATTFYWRDSDTLVIDGRTQTAFTGDTNPVGAEVVLHGDEFFFNASGSALYGLHAGAVTFSASNNVASGNTGGIHLTLFDGSGSLLQNNVCGTIKIDRSDHNIVIGNITERVRVLGFGPNAPATANRVGGPELTDRNFITGYGTWNSEGLPSGTTVELASTSGTLIENNWIGTTPDGLEQGNLASTQGIWMFNDNNATVIRDNRIAGILGHGQGPHHAGQLFGRAILVSGSGTGVTITGNTIGLDANDEPVLGSVTGIDAGNDAASTVLQTVIENNVIAGHLFNGITVGHDVQQVRISGNDIFGNESLGIDLVPGSYGYGVTLNDPLDADNGGNGLQNFPVLSSASSSGASVTIGGTVHSAPNNEFTVEFFASPEPDPTGHGEGTQYIGQTTVTTNAAGNADFDITLPAAVDLPCVISATATLEPLGATSEFSAAIPCTDGGSSPVIQCSLTLASGSGDGSFSYTLSVTNTTSSAQNTDIWMDVIGPDGYSALAFQRNMNLGPSASRNKTRDYTIRRGTAGEYAVTLYTGVYPDSIDDSDTQIYTKIAEAVSGFSPLSDLDVIPGTTDLYQNYPNPFNPSTVIRYGLNEDTRVSVRIYNALGQEVKTVVEEFQAAGYYEVRWDGTNQIGQKVSSGLYLSVLTAGYIVKTEKLLLSK